MKQIIKHNLLAEIEHRISKMNFSEQHRNCLVVRLNDDYSQKNSLQESIFKLRAHGFKASKSSAETTSFIVLTNARDIAILGSITDVETNQDDDSRINIHFRDPVHIEVSELQNYITWNNSNPVRRFDLTI